MDESESEAYDMYVVDFTSLTKIPMTKKKRITGGHVLLKKYGTTYFSELGRKGWPKKKDVGDQARPLAISTRTSKARVAR